MKTFERLLLVHRAWRYRLRTEPDEIAFVRALSRRGELLVDIGAHRGAFTYWMAKAVGPDGLVLAFEPIPELAVYLDSIARTYPDRRIRIFDCALSNSEGTAQLHLAGHHLGAASLESDLDVMGPPIDVRTDTLDACLSGIGTDKVVSLIKCDVEHHELSVFEGAQATLRQSKPLLLFESGNLLDGQQYFGPVFEFLESLGYIGHFFFKSSLVGLSEFDPDRFSLAKSENQNYVFVHREQLVSDSRLSAWALSSNR
jgi:FkbM family methyltransferase